MTLLIRPLQRDDEADWRRLWTAYLDFYETSVSPEVYETYFERLLGADPRDYSGLIAFRGEEAV
ncbi:MAG: GNAT family N-acetyltransferase, partial [Rubricella sp.]